jgi:hypothetical protein
VAFTTNPIYCLFNGELYLFIGMFVKLQKATISTNKSLQQSIHMEQLGSHWTDFHEI